MRKLFWLTTITVLFLVFVAPALLALGIKMVPAQDQPGYNPNQRLSIYGKREVSQKFISKEKNLTAVGTSIRNPNLKNKKEIILKLYDSEEKLVRTSVLNGEGVEDGAFIKFVFEPIADSLGKEYKFSLSTPQAGPEETIEVFYIKDAPEFITEYTYDEESYSGGLPLVTFHKPNSKREVIKDIYTSWLSRFLLQSFRKIL